MVLTSLIGAGLGTALAYPTGFLFGYGYGSGVRHGYNSYKPSENPNINKLHTSPNPLDGALGAGALSAEERTSQVSKQIGLPMTNDPSLTVNANQAVSNDPWVYSKVGGVPRMKKSQLTDHTDYVNFVKYGIDPNTGKVHGGATKARLYQNKRLNSRY